MPIKAIYDERPTEPITLSPDDFVETDDGKWMPNVEAVGDVRLEDVGALRGALTKSKKNLGDAERKLRAFGEHTPETIAELAALAEASGETENLDEKAKALAEQRVKAIEAKAKKDSDALTKTLDTFQRSWAESETDRALLEHMTAIGAPRELLPIYKQGVRSEIVDADDGRKTVALKVLGEGGGPRLTNKPNSSAEMDVAEYVESFRDHPTFSRLFPGTGSSGSGAGNPGPSTSQAGGVMRISRSDQDAMNANIDRIANGEAIVVD